MTPLFSFLVFLFFFFPNNDYTLMLGSVAIRATSTMHVGGDGVVHDKYEINNMYRGDGIQMSESRAGAGSLSCR